MSATTCSQVLRKYAAYLDSANRPWIRSIDHWKLLTSFLSILASQCCILHVRQDRGGFKDQKETKKRHQQRRITQRTHLAGPWATNRQIGVRSLHQTSLYLSCRV